MAIFSIVIFGLVLASFSLLLSIIFKTNIFRCLPIACTLVILTEFILGFIGLLKYSIYILIILSILSFIITIYVSCKKHVNITIDYKLLLLFVFISLFFIATIGNKLFNSWDEFSHWGSVVKTMTIWDDFGTNINSTLLYKSYPPAVSLFQYFIEEIGIKIIRGEFSEWLCNFSLYTFELSFLFPLFSNKKTKVVDYILFILISVFLPFVFLQECYSTIYVDTCIAILFCSGFYSVCYQDELVDKLRLFCIILLLPIIKDSGLFFSLTLSIAYCLKMLKNKELKIKDILFIFSLYIPKVLWIIKIKVENVNVFFANKIDFINLINVLLGRDNSYRIQVIKNFINKLYQDGIFIGTTGIRINYIVFSIFTFVIIYIIAKSFDKQKSNDINKYTGAFWTITFIVYSVGQCIMYMYKFSESEALNLASFSRYINTYYLSAWLFIMFSLVRLIKEKNEENIFKELIIILFIVLFIPMDTVIPYVFRMNVVGSIEMRELYIPIADETKQKCKQDEKIWFVCQTNHGVEGIVYKYLVDPIKVPNVDTPAHNNYDSYLDIDKNDWKNTLLKDYDYVVLYNIDEYFVNKYSDVFEEVDKIRNNSIFKIDKEKGLLVTY